ncbi:MAG: HAD family hydrolase [Proteobacteria bacterium]|nr:HAD family hydrolase [Pseudomonadota bacterium]
MPKKAAIFFDRDGTLIHDAHYPSKPDDVRFMPGAREALIQLQQQGFLLFIISNQSGIGRGYITPEEAESVYRKVAADLEASGIKLGYAYYCPHSPDDNCQCRKPSPYMLMDAADKFNLEISRSFMVGDRGVDIETGKRAGCRTILLRENLIVEEQESQPDYIAADWSKIVAYIEGK